MTYIRRLTLENHPTYIEFEMIYIFDDDDDVELSVMKKINFNGL